MQERKRYTLEEKRQHNRHLIVNASSPEPYTAVMRKTRRSRRIAQLKAIKQALRKRLHEKPVAG